MKPWTTDLTKEDKPRTIHNIKKELVFVCGEAGCECKELDLDLCDVEISDLHKAKKAECTQCGEQEKEFFMCMN